MSDKSIKDHLFHALYSHNNAYEEAFHLFSLLSNPHKVRYSNDSTILHFAAYYGALDIVKNINK